MPKAGSDYNELVLRMAEALYPHFQVKMGQWIEGPDGKREVDVEVRGILNEIPFFLIIECKDLTKPADINFIDNLDSKGRDLQATHLMICSNSGFTKKALGKAKRVCIDAISVLNRDNKLVKLMLTREYVAKKLSVDSWDIKLFTIDQTDILLPDIWDARELYFNNLPLVNWLNIISANLLIVNEGSHKIVATYAFKKETDFLLSGILLKLSGIQIHMTCSRKWLSQIVNHEVSLGCFNWIRDCITVPNNQNWSIGSFDNQAWQEISNEADEFTFGVEPATFQCDITLMNPIQKNPSYEVPQIDEIVSEFNIEAT